MLRTIDLRGHELRPAQLRRVLPRGGTDVAAVVDKVAPLVHRVRHEGAAAAHEQEVDDEQRRRELDARGEGGPEALGQHPPGEQARTGHEVEHDQRDEQ